jgi:hypothetical protein
VGRVLIPWILWKYLKILGCEMQRTPGTLLADDCTVYSDAGVILCHAVYGRRMANFEDQVAEARANARLFAASDIAEQLAEAIVNGAGSDVALRLATQFLAKARVSPNPTRTPLKLEAANA